MATPQIVTQAETQYVIHQRDSYVRLASHGHRVVAVMVRSEAEASRFPSMSEAILAAFTSDIGHCKTWAVEAVKGRTC